jgi:subtilisin family serine protease
VDVYDLAGEKRSAGGGVNRFTLPPFHTATVFLSWNDPAGSSTNNYDLVIFDCTTAAIFSQGTEIQNGSQEPSEAAQVISLSTTSLPVCYAIRNVKNQAAPQTLSVVVDGIVPSFTGCLPTPAEHMFNTLSKSLLAPSDALGDIITVGSAPQCSPNQIEVFSSRGPTFDGRAKPDQIAVDGVSVTGVGGFAEPFPPVFFGTSAAAPHVAGIAALLLQLKPSLTRAQLKSVLQQGAVPLAA